VTALRIRNESVERTLVVRVWHATNPLASDGDNRWLDESGASVPSGTRDAVLSPGGVLDLDANRGLSLTCYPEGTDCIAGIFAPLRRILGGGPPALAVPLSLACANTALTIRIFAGAAFQFSALREENLLPGSTVQLSTGTTGISLKVG